MSVGTAGMVARQRFGEALKQERLNASTADGVRTKVKQTDAARAIKRKTVDRVSRLERGEAWPEPWELDALLKLYNADLATRVRLETMLSEGQAIAGAWWVEYEDEFPESLIEFVAYEDAAKSITTCAANVLPALLQTESYAKALTTGVAGSVLTPAVVDRSVELRRQRRRIFTKPTPTPVEFIFSEAALRQQIGGRDVMLEQLDSLIVDSASRTVSFRVLPFTAPVPSMHIVHLLEFGGESEKPITAFDSMTGMSFQKRPKEVRENRYYIESVRRLALSQLESIAAIKTIKKELSSA
ncbi:DUF5753 domain-containing protein [Streptomyces sp. NPDC059080]|uniref:DUF5753 domain-containing protein n=1 Tax=Streptomyces sp. NPDC059080 TaxID=3346718 RepID=UPI0036A94B17